MGSLEQPMSYTCSLTARKFGQNSTEALLDLFYDCSNGLMLVDPALCRAHAAERSERHRREFLENFYGGT